MTEGSAASDTYIRNFIAKSLGAFWILDGLLQLQPKMFGADFVSQVLVPTLSNQPAFLHSIISFGIYLWNFDPVAADITAALFQIAIGILLFFPLSREACKIGLWLSVVWGVIVWIFGEGAGLLLTGRATFYTGAPGAALLYVLLALYVLVPEKINSARLPQIAGWMLLAGAALQLQPVFWTADGVQTSLMASMMEQVPALNSAPAYLLHMFSVQPIAGNVLLVLVPFIVGLMLILKSNRISGGIALVFLFVVWWAGQDFGMLTTLFAGVSTDPGVAPLMALFMAPLFYSRYSSRYETYVNKEES